MYKLEIKIKEKFKKVQETAGDRTEDIRASKGGNLMPLLSLRAQQYNMLESLCNEMAGIHKQ